MSQFSEFKNLLKSASRPPGIRRTRDTTVTKINWGERKISMISCCSFQFVPINLITGVSYEKERIFEICGHDRILVSMYGTFFAFSTVYVNSRRLVIFIKLTHTTFAFDSVNFPYSRCQIHSLLQINSKNDH